jgi:hypothetical protein
MDRPWPARIRLAVMSEVPRRPVTKMFTLPEALISPSCTPPASAPTTALDVGPTWPLVMLRPVVIVTWP